MTKPYYQLKKHIKFKNYIIASRRSTFDTFTEVLSFRNNRVCFEQYASIQCALNMMVFKTQEDAEKWLRPWVIKMIHGIRKDFNKDYKKKSIPEETIKNYTIRHYKIMTIEKLWNDSRWNEECAESERNREQFNKQLESKGK